MHRSLIFTGVLGLILCTGGFVGWQQRQAAESLQAELANRRDQQRERARLEAENERERANEIAADQLAALRNDRVALRRLRSEFDAAKVRTEHAASSARSQTAGSSAPKPYEPSITKDMVPVEMWRNAGSATPLATLETVLWAAAGGDVELLARNLSLSGDTRAKALELMARVPTSLRGQFNSPEQMIAFFTAKEVPLGSARLIDPETKSDTAVTLVARLRGTDKKTKTAVFSLRQEGEDWKLIVPMPVVEKYAASLQGPGL